MYLNEISKAFSGHFPPLKASKPFIKQVILWSLVGCSLESSLLRILSFNETLTGDFLTIQQPKLSNAFNAHISEYLFFASAVDEEISDPLRDGDVTFDGIFH